MPRRFEVPASYGIPDSPKCPSCGSLHYPLETIAIRAGLISASCPNPDCLEVGTVIFRLAENGNAVIFERRGPAAGNPPR